MQYQCFLALNSFFSFAIQPSSCVFVLKCCLRVEKVIESVTFSKFLQGFRSKTPACFEFSKGAFYSSVFFICKRMIVYFLLQKSQVLAFNVLNRSWFSLVLRFLNIFESYWLIHGTKGRVSSSFYAIYDNFCPNVVTISFLGQGSRAEMMNCLII